MNSSAILTDGFERIKDEVHAVVDGLPAEDLNTRTDPGANSITWLIWHLTRVQDDHIADAAGSEQVWDTGGWMDRFALPLPKDSIGYGQTSKEVGQVRVDSGELLLDYYDATHERTLEFISGLTDADLDRVIDKRWSPPVTMGVRLVSVVNDDSQHVGQAAFVRGILERR